MPLHLSRSQGVEDLVDALASALRGTWSSDPFEAIPIVVGSRGMERWLRHELATRLGSAARFEFLFPGTAFDGAAQWLARRPALDDRSPFWNSDGDRETEWSGPRLELRVLTALRHRQGHPAFARVAAYLGAIEPAVKARELSFSQEVSRTIERLLHDRPQSALEWVEAPHKAPAEHVWLATLLHDLSSSAKTPSPAHRLAELSSAKLPLRDRHLFVFGLSTLRPGDKLWLAALARSLHVNLFALAPSSQWWNDLRKASEQRAALRAASRPDEIESVLAEFDRENAILAANGGPSRDFQLWLETVGYEEPLEHLTAHKNDTLLSRVQAWIDQAADNPGPGEAPWADLAECSSFEVHACHGALRQCEALRDELLRRFAHDPTLEPRHVLVMTPDIATYAPLLAAVFSRNGTGTPSIPLSISDLGLRSTNPVADALLQIIGLADERMTASGLLDLLALHPVRARFGVGEEDLEDLRTMVVTSGIRWGWDDADRERHDQPRLEQNTLRFGLERLAMGVLMPDPGDLGTVTGGADFKGLPIVPVELATRERIARFGLLSELCGTLQDQLAMVPRAATPVAWAQHLRGLLKTFTHVEGGAAWLRVQVDEELERLLGQDGDALELDRSALLALLRNAFDLPQSGDRPVTGAVTVCALEPMRSVPFRIVAMVGFDDGAFPRPGRTAAWDPFSSPRPYEDDRRTIDRHLFLEAILCARDALLIFGTGFEPKRGEHVPMSVVVSELEELIAAGVGRETDEIRREHPLQPWSEQAFVNESRRPYDAQWLQGARELRGARKISGLGATPTDAVWPPEENPPDALTADALARALARPQQELLGRRLSLTLENHEEEVLDREPLEQDTLEKWAIRDRVLKLIESGHAGEIEGLEVRLRGEGTLPLDAGGRQTLEQCSVEARTAHANAQEVAGDRIEALQCACVADELSITAVAPDVRQDGLGLTFVWVTASNVPNETLQMQAWISLCVAVAEGRPVVAAHAVGAKRTFEFRAPLDAATAKQILTTLVQSWRALRAGPSLLFPKLSHALAMAAKKSPDADPAELIEAARDHWEGTGKRDRGDRENVWVAAIFGHLSADDLADHAAEILANAKAVWGPLVDAIVSGRRSAASTSDEPAEGGAPAKRRGAKAPKEAAAAPEEPAAENATTTKKATATRTKGAAK